MKLYATLPLFLTPILSLALDDSTRRSMQMAALKRFHFDMQAKLMGHGRSLEDEQEWDADYDWGDEYDWQNDWGQYAADGDGNNYAEGNEGDEYANAGQDSFNMDCQVGGDGQFVCILEMKTTYYYVQETCTFGDDTATMLCNVCSQDFRIQNADESYFEFCFDLQCSTSTYTKGASMEKSCSCQGASVNAESW